MGKRILLADDSMTIQKLVEMAFVDTDHELICLSNGQEAWDNMAEFKPDVVLADAIMPVLDGYSLCKRVKNSPDFKGVPVVLLTGRFQPFDEQRAEEASIDSRIMKPFVQEQLVELVEKLTEHSPSMDQPEPEVPLPSAEEGVSDEMPMELPTEDFFEDGDLEPIEADFLEDGNLEEANLDDLVPQPEAAVDTNSTIRVDQEELKSYLKDNAPLKPVDEEEEMSGSIDSFDLDEGSTLPEEDDFLSEEEPAISPSDITPSAEELQMETQETPEERAPVGGTHEMDEAFLGGPAPDDDEEVLEDALEDLELDEDDELLDLSDDDYLNEDSEEWEDILEEEPSDVDDMVLEPFEEVEDAAVPEPEVAEVNEQEPGAEPLALDGWGTSAPDLPETQEELAEFDTTIALDRDEMNDILSDRDADSEHVTTDEDESSPQEDLSVTPFSLTGKSPVDPELLLKDTLPLDKLESDSENEEDEQAQSMVVDEHPSPETGFTLDTTESLEDEQEDEQEEGQVAPAADEVLELEEDEDDLDDVFELEEEPMELEEEEPLELQGTESLESLDGEVIETEDAFEPGGDEAFELVEEEVIELVTEEAMDVEETLDIDKPAEEVPEPEEDEVLELGDEESFELIDEEILEPVEDEVAVLGAEEVTELEDEVSFELEEEEPLTMEGDSIVELEDTPVQDNAEPESELDGLDFLGEPAEEELETPTAAEEITGSEDTIPGSMPTEFWDESESEQQDASAGRDLELEEAEEDLEVEVSDGVDPIDEAPDQSAGSEDTPDPEELPSDLENELEEIASEATLDDTEELIFEGDPLEEEELVVESDEDDSEPLGDPLSMEGPTEELTDDPMLLEELDETLDEDDSTDEDLFKDSFDEPLEEPFEEVPDEPLDEPLDEPVDVPVVESLVAPLALVEEAEATPDEVTDSATLEETPAQSEDVEPQEKPDTDRLEEEAEALPETIESNAVVTLNDEQMDLLVNQVVEKVIKALSDQAVKEVAWEVVPALAEVMVERRIFELEKDK